MTAKRRSHPRLKFDKEALFEDYYTNNMSQAELAAKYSYTQGGIALVLRRFGIPAKTKATRNQYGERNNNWGGDTVSYFGAHKRIRRILGKPRCCEHCNKTTEGRYEWANKTGNFLDPADYIRLCKSCHCTYDGIIFNIKHMRDKL